MTGLMLMRGRRRKFRIEPSWSGSLDSFVHRTFLLWVAAMVLLTILPGETVEAAEAAPARLVKVLPHFVDRQNRIALSPSLYERDAYQAQLRANPDQRLGLRFDVQWRAQTRDTFRLRVELRGNLGSEGTSAIIEERVTFKGFINSWSKVHFTGAAYVKFGELSAWRATLWDGDTLIAEQKSFLW